ncbi:MAG TPA: tRNA (adenosine(37)-N6)-threonylcarbamoyltransferase complex ATPase subunit type 1 TsaE [Bacillota bacterium]|jgi:tRNA threonylcarbamoyladenosine biosynthesis protein TsaE|nr:tRNA (adenosine(37)-N6)-threonylcarbamoyltransferase complex ATPase subunit type 1 TsaE [Bacillota bacterium]HQD42169.1 tRNA (adenosine(37)-N6)-threonylcarbamoyltransferase complex ATPase subunit type 1 TsaE [Bacillota bacterium]
MRYSFVSKSPEDTLEFGIRLGKNLGPGDVVCLEGELGAGKTVLTIGIAEGLGIKTGVTSPTFTIINEYPGEIPLYHIDLYRLEDGDEFYYMGGEDLMYGQGVSVIEWASRAEGILPEDCLWISIKRLDESEDFRLIELTVTEKRRDLLERVSKSENTGY